MSAFTDAQNDLVRKIVAGKCPRRQVSEELRKMKQDFPNEEFSSLEPQRKQKPWSMDYLMELENLFYHGADSKEFIEYMAEVSDEVHRASRMKKAILIVLLVAIAAVIIIIALSFWRG